MDRELKEKFLVALKFIEEFPRPEEEVRETLSRAVMELIGSTRSLNELFPKAHEAISKLKVSFRYEASTCRILVDVAFKDRELASGVELFSVHLPPEGTEYISPADVMIEMNRSELNKLARIILDHLLWLVCEVVRRPEEPDR